MLAAKDVIKTPFIVINADDYYGKEGFLRNLCCYLADRIQELGDIIEEQSRQLLMEDLAIGRTSGEENGWIPAEDARLHFTERI